MTIDLEELRQKKAAEELAAQRAETDAEGRPVVTAFAVILDTNGQWTALPLDQLPVLAAERAPVLDDMIGGCSSILTGCQAQQTAFQTVVMMQQQTQAIMQQQANQRIASQIDPSKLRVN